MSMNLLGREPKTERVEVRLTLEEKERLELTANSLNIPMSDVLRYGLWLVQDQEHVGPPWVGKKGV